MESSRKGIIFVIGDSFESFSEIIHETNPQAFGLLCYTNQGLAKSTEFLKNNNIDLSCCRFEVVQGLIDKREFFRKSSSLIDFLIYHCKAEVASICVGDRNLEALALAAIVAHQTHTMLRIEDSTVHLKLDSGGAMLVDSLSSIVKEFNLFRYKDVLVDIERISPKIRSSRGKTYVSLLYKLALANYDWDCRRYAQACSTLKEAKDLLEGTRDDFSHVYEYFKTKMQSNIEFLEKLSQNQAILGGIDAFFNGNRRYDAADNLICVLALANSVEFCVRARLISRKYDPDDISKLNKALKRNFGDKAKDFFIRQKIFHVDKFDPEKDQDRNATVSPGFSYKPGFADLLQVLRLVDDNFFKDIAGVIDAPENQDYLSIKQLNSLRNKIVHRMGAVSEEDLPKAIKLAEYVIEKFLARISVDSPRVFAQVSPKNPDSLVLQASRYANHISLDLRDITLGVFG